MFIPTDAFLKMLKIVFFKHLARNLLENVEKCFLNIQLKVLTLIGSNYDLLLN